MKDQRYGSLTVLQVYPKENFKPNSPGYSLFCLCDCGNTISFEDPGCLLTKRGRKSCGCIKQKPVRKPSDLWLRVYQELMGSAKERNYSFTLTFLEVILLCSKNCSYCGTPPSNKIATRSKETDTTITLYWTGIDRLDNSKGYELNNVTPCCKICNRAKRELPEDAFNIWLDQVAKHRILTKEKINRGCISIEEVPKS